MKDIPTIYEAEALRKAYREAYGDSSYAYQNDMLDWLEFRLLNDTYEDKFGDTIGTMCISKTMTELNAEIRKCLKNGILYDDGIPEGALI